jgi:ArsR family transcriptional regulator, arsenate/arsenite/antimonite-responsive transcriptional repressor
MPDIFPCTKCFNTLGVSSRMKIYNLLRKKGRETVSGIVDVIKLTQPTISYHLKEMKDAGLLINQKVGKEVYYAINAKCPTSAANCVLKTAKFPQS